MERIRKGSVTMVGHLVLKVCKGEVKEGFAERGVESRLQGQVLLSSIDPFSN